MCVPIFHPSNQNASVFTLFSADSSLITTVLTQRQTVPESGERGHNQTPAFDSFDHLAPTLRARKSGPSHQLFRCVPRSRSNDPCHKMANRPSLSPLLLFVCAQLFRFGRDKRLLLLVVFLLVFFYYLVVLLPHSPPSG